MHLIKHAYYMYLIVIPGGIAFMTPQKLLIYANNSLITSLLIFIISLFFAYGLESQLPLLVVTLLHIFQLLLAGIFKLSYVARLVAQQQLGQIPG